MRLLGRAVYVLAKIPVSGQLEWGPSPMLEIIAASLLSARMVLLLSAPMRPLAVILVPQLQARLVTEEPVRSRYLPPPEWRREILPLSRVFLALLAAMECGQMSQFPAAQ